jgi:hypothetical protein
MTIQLTQTEFEALQAEQQYEDATSVDNCDKKLEVLAGAGVLDENAEGAFGHISRKYYAQELDYNLYLRESEGKFFVEIGTEEFEPELVEIEIC